MRLLMLLFLIGCVTDKPTVLSTYEKEYLVKCKVTEYRDFLGFRNFVKICRKEVK